MKLPRTDRAEDYVGLYVIDFGEQCSIGYTAEEVAEVLESERFRSAKVYKIHRAQPDGTMELHGVPRERFSQESGMFFHCRDEAAGQIDFRALSDWGRRQSPPCRAKLHLARNAQGKVVMALIYPAEYEQEISRWMQDSQVRGSGPVDAGVSQVAQYYQGAFEILQREQFWPAASSRARDREELLAQVGRVWQR